MAEKETTRAPKDKPREHPEAPREGKQPYSSEMEDYRTHDVAKPPPDTEGKRDHGRKQ